MASKVKPRAFAIPSNPTCGCISQGNEINISKRYLQPMFIAASFTIAKMWKQPKRLSVNEWIKKNWCVCVYTYIWCIYLHTIYMYTWWNIIQPGKQGNPVTCKTWIDLEGIMLSGIRQIKANTIDTISHMWNLKKSETHKSRELNGDYQGWEVRKSDDVCQTVQTSVFWGQINSGELMYHIVILVDTILFT